MNVSIPMSNQISYEKWLACLELPLSSELISQEYVYNTNIIKNQGEYKHDYNSLKNIIQLFFNNYEMFHIGYSDEQLIIQRSPLLDDYIVNKIGWHIKRIATKIVREISYINTSKSMKLVYTFDIFCWQLPNFISEDMEIIFLLAAYKKYKDVKYDMLTLPYYCVPIECYRLLVKEDQIIHQYLMFDFPKYDKLLIDINITSASLQNVYKVLGQQLIDAVQSVHDLGFYHGDLKPYNVCIYNNEKIVLIDFGACNYLHKPLVNIVNTQGWFTPIQAYYHAVLFDKDYHTNYAVAISDLLINKYHIPYMDDKKNVHYDTNNLDDSDDDNKVKQPYKFYESGRFNDWFIVGMLLLFIYNNKYLFWWKKHHTMTQLLCNQVFDNVILFLNDPITYVNFIRSQCSTIPTKAFEQLTKFFPNWMDRSDFNL